MRINAGTGKKETKGNKGTHLILLRFTNTGVTFTAQVAGLLGDVPTGSVTFTEDSNTLGTVPLTAGVASIPFGFQVLGLHTVSAHYNPLAPFAPSSNTITQVEKGSGVIVSTNPKQQNRRLSVLFSIKPLFHPWRARPCGASLGVFGMHKRKLVPPVAEQRHGPGR